MYIVYSLIDPRDHKARYVGCSADLYARFLQHLRCDGTNVQKDIWIQDLRKAGYLPIVQTLEQVEAHEQAKAREDYWMHHYLYLGMPLLNVVLPAPHKRAETGQKVGRKRTEAKSNRVRRYYKRYGRLPSNLTEDERFWYSHHMEEV